MNCSVGALFNEMSREIVGLKCPGSVLFSAFLASFVEHDFFRSGCKTFVQAAFHS